MSSGPVAEGKFVFSEDGLQQIEDKLEKVRKKADGLLSSLPKEIQRQIKAANQALAEEIKGMVPAAINSVAGAAVAPAKSTFAQVIEEANRHRRNASMIAVATGKDVGEVSARIQAAARATKEMPETVVGWARSVRDLTGDFDGAISMMGAAKDRALQLDKPIGAIADQAARLSQSFGTKSKQELDTFFGTMDAQAAKAGTSVQRLDRQFMTFLDSFGRLSSKGGSAFSGLSAAFAASNPNPEQAIRNQGFGMGLLNSGVRQIEQRMRLGGVLKRGESLTDTETGEVDPKKYLAAMKFLQKDVVKYYGSKRRAIEVQAGDDLEGRRDVAGFLSADLSKVTDLAQLSPEQRKAFDRYSGLAAGKREGSDVAKTIKDQNAGAPLLGAQDAAVDLGGGAAGLAMNQAAGLFSGAVDRFGGIVGNMVGAAAGRGAATAAAGAGMAATAAGGFAGMAGKTIAKRALGAIPVVGGLASLGLMGYELYQGYKASHPDQPQSMAGLPAAEPGSAAGPQEIAISQATHRAAAEATAAALANRVVRVQLVPTTEAPQSQSAPR